MRRRERQIQSFKSSDQAQGFLYAHSFTYGHFRLRRHRMPASIYRVGRAEAFRVAARRRLPAKQSDRKSQPPVAPHDRHLLT